MAKPNNTMVQRAYDTIYDYLMNKSEHADAYKTFWRKEEHAGDWFFPADHELFELLYELRDTIRYEKAKENGTGNLHKVIERLIKKSDGSRPQCSGIYKHENGYTYYTDSYVMFKTEEELDLPTYDAQPLNYEAIVKQSDIRFMREVYVPSTSELKTYKKLNKNNNDVTENGKTVYYVRNENDEAVAMFDVQYLLNCREGIGDEAKCYVQKGCKSQISPMVMVTEKTYALVVPMRSYGETKTKWEVA